MQFPIIQVSKPLVDDHATQTHSRGGHSELLQVRRTPHKRNLLADQTCRLEWSLC